MPASRNICFKLSSAQIRLAVNHEERTIQFFSPKRLLSAPVPISPSDIGLKIDPKKASLFQSFYLTSTLKLDTCYNEYCPSLQEQIVNSERVIDRHTWKNCLLFHLTIAALKKNRRVCQSKQLKDFLADDMFSEESDVEDDVWVTDAGLTVADDQANIFERINQVFYFFVLICIWLNKIMKKERKSS